MSEQERHDMKLVDILPSGIEDWYCPICGRRLMIQWNPHFDKTVVVPGDENAYHTGGKGINGAELTIERPNVTTHLIPGKDFAVFTADGKMIADDTGIHPDFTPSAYYEEPFSKFMETLNLDDL